MPNRLAHAVSPYLRQHADNPVAWWPWGEEAWAEARRLDRPVFVSIGYAACHWCHVMAHESFADEATAAVLNRRFVCIKVDREELPEVDAVYMNAIAVQGEGGGWPLSAFCAPDGRPFYMGTYFPDVDRHGRPAFVTIVNALADAWDQKRELLVENMEGLHEGLGHLDAHFRGNRRTTRAGWDDAIVAGVAAVVARLDPQHGGLQGAPKFPASPVHALLRHGRGAQAEPARVGCRSWMEAMARGGIYDHLGGGFARYSVDAMWRVPHFEKMLSDQALLLARLADAIVLGAAWLAAVVHETVAFLAREMSDQAGGLWSAVDADSKADDGSQQEGAYYAWTPSQLVAALGAGPALLFGAAYHVTAAGNWEHGRSVLERRTPRGTPAEEAELAQLRNALYAVRAQRPAPTVDTKVLTSTNALAVRGLLRAYAVTDHLPARELALRVAAFLRRDMYRVVNGEPQLARVYGEGQATRRATLEDCAAMALALFDLADATGDAEAWRDGAALLAAARTNFVDETGERVRCFVAAPDELLPHRPESHQDGATPSGASLLVEAVVRYGLVAADGPSLALAERILNERLDQASPFASPSLLVAADLLLRHRLVVVTAGEGAADLIATCRLSPNPCVILCGPWSPHAAAKSATADGQAQAYVCHQQTCAAPTTSAAELRRALM